jgi:hypothetical protein
MYKLQRKWTLIKITIFFNMELKIQIDYKELLSLIRQLPASQLSHLKKELTDSSIAEKAKLEKDQLKQLLLNGPVMTDEEYENYQHIRKWMNQWRTS